MPPAQSLEQRQAVVEQREAEVAERERRVAQLEAQLQVHLTAAGVTVVGTSSSSVGGARPIGGSPTASPLLAGASSHTSLWLARTHHRTASGSDNGSKEGGTPLLKKSLVENTAGDDDDPKIHGAGFRLYLSQGRFLRSVVFGGLDGLTTTMVLICSVSGIGHTASHDDHPRSTASDLGGLHVSAGVVATLGVATTVADAFSMGIGDFLSSLADSETAGTAMHSKMEALWNGTAMFVSFMVFGFIPLTAYLPFLPVASLSDRLRLAGTLFLLSLFLLGVTKAAVTAPSRTAGTLLRTGGTMVGTGSVASLIAYILSRHTQTTD